MTAPYGFKYTETALRFLETMVPVKIRGQIKRRIESLAYDPTPPGSKKIRVFRESSGRFWGVIAAAACR
jgi:hypothetical protein